VAKESSAKEERTFSFRASPEVADAIDEHFRRLCRQTPGVVFYNTQAITSLIVRGALGFEEDDRNREEDE
jgi:hypothetical protein